MTYDSLWGVGNDGYIRSEVAVLEEDNAYNLAMNNESVFPSNMNIRYGAFPDNPMCGAEYLVLILIF